MVYTSLNCIIMLRVSVNCVYFYLLTMTFLTSYIYIVLVSFDAIQTRYKRALFIISCRTEFDISLLHLSYSDKIKTNDF